jgi:tetratricopeptide (TPR) repeat protein
MKQVSANNAAINTLLSSAYRLFRGGDFSDAERDLEEALSIDFDHREVLSALKCAQFWSGRFSRYNSTSDPFEKGEYLFKEWKVFVSFLDRIGDNFEQCVYAVRQWVFGQSLFQYSRLQQDGQDTELLFRLGRCYKGMGNYEQALEYLEHAGRFRKEDPEILAELADCYAFIGEVKAAKVFFREAFFLNPQKIDLAFLESMLIRRLIQRLCEGGLKDPELAEWIPVYGVLYGVFTVKRELKPLEYGKLRQSIFLLEQKLKENSEKARQEYIVPRLMNRYFWLIDHYVSAKESRKKVDEVLTMIKQLDHSIYDLYIN